MRKVNRCKECNQVTDYFICDTCGIKLLQIPITVSFGYWHYLDGEEYHFCTNKCLRDFVNNEIKKCVK